MTRHTPEQARKKTRCRAVGWHFLPKTQLSDEEETIRDSARACCEDKLLPRMIAANRYKIIHR